MNAKATYKSSGVNIDQANAFVKGIKAAVTKTHSSSVLRRDGAFGGLFSLASMNYRKPVLVSSTDGVGTKLLLAQQFGIHGSVGVDLVAMNVNDILCVGAKPLFFLDYIACGRLDPVILKQVVTGIAKGCRQSDCSLIGGETAEMPGMYKKNEYDLAGFAVGVVEEKDIIDGRNIRAGDAVVGFPSSGIHSNGYSLVRKVLSKSLLKTHAMALLQPTKIYAKEVALLTSKFRIKGIAHITGGAYYDKLTKVLPKGRCFSLNLGSWPIPKVFHLLQKEGRIEESEMFRTFNMGIGLAVVIAEKNVVAVRATLKKQKIRHYHIGRVINHQDQKVVFQRGAS